jgi:hypothetical protein
VPCRAGSGCARLSCDALIAALCDSTSDEHRRSALLIAGGFSSIIWNGSGFCESVRSFVAFAAQSGIYLIATVT